jgi:DNA modification methylase
MATRPSAVIDTRVVYCGENLDQLRKFPAGSVDLIYIDPPFNSNRNYEVFWGETKEKRAFEDRQASLQAFRRQPGCEIKPLTVREISDEEMGEED